MTTLRERLDATRERLVHERQRLVVGGERTRRALVRALRDEAGAWQRFATEKQTDAERALAAVRSRTGIERAMLRVAERTLADAHATVRARLGRLDRELLPNASPAAPTQHTAESAENAKPRARARHKRRSA